MVIWSEPRMGQYRVDEQREDAPYFRFECETEVELGLEKWPVQKMDGHLPNNYFWTVHYPTGFVSTSVQGYDRV